MRRVALRFEPALRLDYALTGAMRATRSDRSWPSRTLGWRLCVVHVTALGGPERTGKTKRMATPTGFEPVSSP